MVGRDVACLSGPDLPGVCENASQMDKPFPPSCQLPSTWYAAVAVPNANDAGKLMRSGSALDALDAAAEAAARSASTAEHARRMRSAVPELSSRRPGLSHADGPSSCKEPREGEQRESAAAARRGSMMCGRSGALCARTARVFHSGLHKRKLVGGKMWGGPSGPLLTVALRRSNALQDLAGRRAVEAVPGEPLKLGEKLSFYTADSSYHGGTGGGDARREFACGQYFDGRWENDEQEGHGSLKTKDGNSYEGEWSGGNMHGQGTYTWSSGSSYSGQWEGGIKHGEGTPRCTLATCTRASGAMASGTGGGR